ncbi:cation channel sperm-associated protein subunit delta isoform X1 [Crotalus tigris]|uniref:cation channel sperm-associated protein subunit delta isoform X1 n=1 Tax=Crotalus tigris TaxID=88082 RepID=UPI00192F69DF|nr:cation channel sperm-associated protein subunit delta isoform X1 [Crotalus tigris]
MLLPLLVKFWLSPIMAVDSWPCSYEQLISSVWSHHLVMSSSGMLLNFSHNHPYILHHPCRNNFFRGISPALYLGERLFISLDMFESSILPLTIPNGFTRPPAIVSAAVFVQDTIVAVVNGAVFVYFYATSKKWLHSKGITHLVTELASYNCCFALNDPACDKINELVLAYNPGNLVSKSEIFYSKNGASIFESLKSRPLRDGILLGIYVFASSAHIGMLLKDASHSETAYFTYGTIESMKNEIGTSFSGKFLNGYKVESTLPPGMKGFILLWTNKTLMSSSNDGLTTNIITVLPTDSYPNKTLPESICFAAATDNEIAVLTETQLFYGNLDMVSGKMVHLGDNNVSSVHVSCQAMSFENIGTLSIIRPFPSNVSKYYHFHKCIINVQAKLMTVEPPLQSCPMEILTGDFHNRMYYIDTNQRLHFNATFVPKPGTGAYPYVMLSNPRVLAFEAYIVEDGYTFNGNTKYSLQIKLEEQHVASMLSEKQNISLLKKLSSVSVDIYNKGIFCIDMYPLTALIAVECPPKKHIRILRSTTGCSKGLFEPILLQNFVYSIDKKLYDPLFLGRKNLEQEDLNVSYKYDTWGCPLFLYYDKPWLPDLELWDNDEFVEYVSADFVLYEINGMHNYDYLLTEIEANCLSEAQNWTKQLANFPGSPQIAWTRYNYVSCKEPRENKSLPSANSKYQVLKRDERNRILFPQYNGFYVFRITVVDSLYSYCDLSTIFSVYVYGALPKSEVSVGKALINCLVLIFGTMLTVYFFLKLLKEYSTIK